MAETRTSARTKTFTRMRLITGQVEIALRRITTLLDSSLQAVIKGIESQWIEYVIVYGLDESAVAFVEFLFQIDWERHELHIGNGEHTITIDERWRDGASPEVEVMTRLFNEYVGENGLTAECRIAYRVGVNRDSANRVLGGTRAHPVRWAGEWTPWHSPINEIDELILELNLVT